MAAALQGCVASAADDEMTTLGATDERAGIASDAEALQCNAGKPLVARGAFSCDFGLASDLPLELVPALIERDRMYMAARPGMRSKHLPLSQDQQGNVFSGGRYLFDTVQQAQDYKSWVENDFYLDGVEFLSRPVFLAPECHAWKVIGAHEFSSDDAAQSIMRTERWSVPAAKGNIEGILSAVWPVVRADARARGLKAVWLTYSKQEHLVQLVYFSSGSASAPPNAPDIAAVSALASVPTFGDLLAGPSWTKTFDRTQFVFTRWYPFEAGDHGAPSLWPNSPPFPESSCGDGVCEVSRGETAIACPSDCPLNCGDTVCQPGEDTHNCPGDCRLP
jgi:hypothetical protein